MEKSKILLAFVTILTVVFLLNSVSASHTYFTLSDNIVFKEDVKGEDRGFSLSRSTDVSRLTPSGYYDWSYMPKTVVYPSQESYKISDRLALQAFKTFSRDSQDENKIRLERERNRYSYFGYGSYYPRYYGGYYGSYYRYSF